MGDCFGLRLQSPEIDELLECCPYHYLKELVTDNPFGTIELCLYSRVIVCVDCNEEPVDLVWPEVLVGHFQGINDQVAEFVPSYGQYYVSDARSGQSPINLPQEWIDLQALLSELVLGRVG